MHPVKKLVLVGFIAVAVDACGSQDLDIPPQSQYVRIPQDMLSTEFIRATGFNPDHKRDDAFAFGYISKDALATLTPETLDQIVQLDARLSQVTFDPKTLMYDPDELKSDEDAKLGYHDYHQLTKVMEDLNASHTKIAQLQSAGTSVQGRELWYMKISDNVRNDEDEPKLLYIANMHGDEVVGRELMIYLIKKLLKDYKSDERVRNLVNNAQIYIMPSMNPDGFEKRRRTSALDVDLNRNFPDFIEDPKDRITGRQKETKHIMKLHKQHHFVQAFNFHGGSVCINLPWDTKANTKPKERFGEDPFLSAIAKEYAKNNAPMGNSERFKNGVTYGFEWYRVVGGLQDWANHYRRSIHATVELSEAKWPAVNKLADYWQDNEEALLRYLERGITGAHLRLVNPEGKPVGGAAITVASTSHRTVKYDNGFIHKPTLFGKQVITISAPGYKDKTVEVEASAFDGQYKNVVLEAK